MANGRTPNSDSQEIFSWLIIIGALIVVWPIGLVLLFRKLTKSNRAKSNPQRTNTARPYSPPQQYQQPGTQGVRDNAYAAASRRLPPIRGRGLLIGGACTAGLFGLALLSTVGDAVSSIAYGGSLSWYLEDLFIMGGFCGVGLVLLAVGLSRIRKSKRYRRYLPLIGSQTSLSLETLAKALSVPVHTVQDDLQDMLDSGILPTGYLDLSTGRLVLSAEGIHEEAPAPEPEPSAAPSESDRILSETRAVNDDIDDVSMSQKIDRIEEITRKIFDYQEKHPDKSGQLRTFLNYYLPTTLKILRSYAQMEEQGVEGANISAAKARIEGMMDKVVEGFEKQLDQLFANTAMDITADVSVLERMLEKDGLSQKEDSIRLEL